MLPSLSGLTLAPNKPHNVTPSIGMDAGPSAAVSSLERWVVLFTNPATGDEDVPGLVVKDDGGPMLIVRAKDGRLVEVSRDNVELVDRAPEEAEPALAPAPAPLSLIHI